jgi:hypothetical protein
MTRKAKTKAKWKPGQNRPAASHSSIGWPPLGCFTKDSAQSKTLHRADLIQIPQRVRVSRFSGASSFASATDLRYGRDPTANHRNVSQPPLALKALGRIKQTPF